MGRAIAQAGLAAAEGEVPVGAVIADASGRILAECRNACAALNDVTAHAEILALREAGRAVGNYRLNGCVLVATLEPCAMCAAAIVQARLAGIVYGAADALAGAVVSRAEYLDAPACPGEPVWHMGGVMSRECAALLRDFFALRRRRARLAFRPSNRYK